MAAQALAVNGAKVYIVGRTAEKLETVIETYGKDIAGKIIASTADVSKKDSIAKLYEEISSKEDHLDVSESFASQLGIPWQHKFQSLIGRTDLDQQCRHQHKHLQNREQDGRRNEEESL
jgi:short-subunit dehydrogenase involved in D-alanine esterification of teichoic acids